MALSSASIASPSTPYPKHARRMAAIASGAALPSLNLKSNSSWARIFK
jgi:hypothetical protein